MLKGRDKVSVKLCFMNVIPIFIEAGISGFESAPNKLFKQEKIQ
jgi:hypothetical protein